MDSTRELPDAPLDAGAESSGNLVKVPIPPHRDRRQHRLMRRPAPIAAILVLLGGLTAGPSAGQREEPEANAPRRAPSTAVAALLRVLEASSERSLAAQVARTGVEQRALEMVAESALGPSSLGWHGEGFDSSFGRELNGIDYYTYVQPFRLPGRGARALRSEVGRWREVTTRAELLENVATGGRLWLALAAEADALQILESRVERTERALEIYRVRLEVGEVAGSEVHQLELQRAQDLAMLSDRRRAHEGHRAELSTLLGVPVELPSAGDLAAVEAWLARGRSATGATTMSPSSPHFERVALEESVQLAQSDLAKRTAWGDPTFAFDWEHVPSLGGMPSIDAFGIELSVPLPFGRQGKARRAAARSAAHNARATAALERRSLNERVARALQREEEASQLLEEFGALRDRLESIETSVFEQFRLGAISYLRFLDGLSRVDEHRLREVGARLDLLGARLERAALFGDQEIFPLPRAVLATPDSPDSSPREPAPSEGRSP